MKLNIDMTKYTAKPTGNEWAVAKRLKQPNKIKDVTINDIKKAVCSGMTITAGTLAGTTSEDWTSQQVFIFDIDNEAKTLPRFTPEDVVRLLKANNIPVAFMYWTFSNKPEHAKFRVVTFCDDVITEPDEAKQIILGVMGLFPTTKEPNDEGIIKTVSQVDLACKNLDRMFYGTNQGVVEGIGEEKPFKKADALKLYQRIKPKELPLPSSSTALARPSALTTGSFDLGRAIDEFDILGYILRTTNSRAARSRGDNVPLNPCPICGHKDDFSVNTAKNTFRCFGASGNFGGNIINYLMAKHNLDIKSAREKFKYELLGRDPKEDKEVQRAYAKAKAKEEEKRRKNTMDKKIVKFPENENAPLTESRATEINNNDHFATDVYCNNNIIDLQLSQQEQDDDRKKEKQAMWAKAQKLLYEDDDKEMLRYWFYVDDKGNTKVSCPLLAEHIRTTAKYIFVRDNAKDTVQRYFYRKGCYRLISDDELKGYIKKYIPLHLQKVRDINEVFNLLITDEKFVDRDDINSDENMINFKNGILLLDKMELVAHSPKHMTTIQIPSNYIEDAKPPETKYFDKYINTLTNDDQKRQDLILQFLGMAISNIKGYRPKKALFMVGDGDTGKSQIRTLAGRLVGKENNSNIGMDKLESTFGASAIYNKRLIGSADMSYMAVDEVKTFKELTGGDDIQFEFKFESQFTARFEGIAWFCCNKLPKFGGDKGKHVYDRMAIIECTNVIPKEEQDPFICDKMLTEVEYIVSLAIKQLKRVINNRYKYIIPPDCEAAKEQYKIDNDPVLQFMEECTTERKDFSDKVTRGKTYKAYKNYCAENSIRFIETAQQFKEILKGIGKDHITVRDGYPYFTSFTLTDTAKANLLEWDGNPWNV